MALKIDSCLLGHDCLYSCEMRIPIISILAFLWVLPVAGSDLFFGQDKARHFLFSACAAGMAGYFASVNPNIRSDRPVVVGCVFAVSLGLGKEIRDSRKPGNHFCYRDLFWDAAGIAAAGLPLTWMAHR